MTFKTTALTFIASETVRGQDAAGNDIADEKSFSFRGYEFPGGVVMIPRTSEADEFYLDRDAVRAHGEAVVTGVEVLDKTLEFDADELRSAVVASVREYGIESLPAPLADWLIPVNEAEMPDGSTLNVTAVQARRVWQVWRALAPVAAMRQEGVRIGPGSTPGTVEITTRYAPHQETVTVVVELNGAFGWCSEQNAPTFEADFTAPPPPAPWERGGKAEWAAQLRREQIAQVRTRLQGRGYRDSQWTDEQIWARLSTKDQPTSGAVAEAMAEEAGQAPVSRQ